MMVVEEKFVKSLQVPPLQMVGFEGLSRRALTVSTHVSRYCNSSFRLLAWQIWLYQSL